MLKPLRIGLVRPFFLLVLFFVFPAWGQQEQTPPKAETPPAAKTEQPTQAAIPADAIHQVNPVKATAESLAEGKRMYHYDCAMCHGAKGDGKGDIAADMKTKVTDFTDSASMKNKTDGELFYVIKYGRGEMQPEGSRAKDAELWNMVNYVRAFAKEKEPAEEKPQH